MRALEGQTNRTAATASLPRQLSWAKARIGISGTALQHRRARPRAPGSVGARHPPFPIRAALALTRRREQARCRMAERAHPNDPGFRDSWFGLKRNRYKQKLYERYRF